MKEKLAGKKKKKERKKERQTEKGKKELFWQKFVRYSFILGLSRVSMQSKITEILWIQAYTTKLEKITNLSNLYINVTQVESPQVC